MRSCKCPNCTANLQIDDNNRDFAFCQYCGTKIMLDDYRETSRYIDEARIRESEDDRIIRLKELEMEERKRFTEERNRKNRITAAIVLGVIGALMMIVGWFAGSASNDSNSPFYMLTLLGFFPLFGGIGLAAKK